MQRLSNAENDDGKSGLLLYEKVIETVSKWGTAENLMFVTGATQATELENIRKIIPDNFLLVPGVGFQGGIRRSESRYYNQKASAGLI